MLFKISMTYPYGNRNVLNLDCVDVNIWVVTTGTPGRGCRLGFRSMAIKQRSHEGESHECSGLPPSAYQSDVYMLL